MTIDQAVAYLGVKRHRLTSPRARERAGIPTLKLGHAWCGSAARISTPGSPPTE